MYRSESSATEVLDLTISGEQLLSPSDGPELSSFGGKLPKSGFSGPRSREIRVQTEPKVSLWKLGIRGKSTNSLDGQSVSNLILVPRVTPVSAETVVPSRPPTTEKHGVLPRG